MIERYVPRRTRITTALRVPKNFGENEEFLADLTTLAGDLSAIVQTEHQRPQSAVTDYPPLRIRIEKPWGFVDAFEGDYLVKQDDGDVSVLPPMVFRGLSLKSIDSV